MDRHDSLLFQRILKVAVALRGTPQRVGLRLAATADYLRKAYCLHCQDLVTQDCAVAAFKQLPASFAEFKESIPLRSPSIARALTPTSRFVAFVPAAARRCRKVR